MMNPDNVYSGGTAVADEALEKMGRRHVRQAVAQIADNFTAKQVYAEPYRQDGITVTAAAEISPLGSRSAGSSADGRSETGAPVK